MKILVCGGAGYIGSHMVRYLRGHGHEAVVFDNLSTGHRQAPGDALLADAAAADGLRSVALCYFNAAGADPSGAIGELHEPETHLIPNVLRAALGHGSGLKVFGDDYATRDGTCVRDYVHVNDLAAAHLAAIEFMSAHEGAHRFNLGNVQGFTVLEVIEAARRATGADIVFERVPRRAGDPPILVTSSARAELDWTPACTEITDIIAGAWRWHRDARY